VAALGARARVDPLAFLHRDDVGAVVRLAGLGIDLVPDVLEHGLVMIDVLAGRAVELPEDAGLADREQRLFASDVDEYSLVDLVEVERLALRVLEIPLQRARVRIER